MTQTPATGRLTDLMEDAQAQRAPKGLADASARMAGVEAPGRDRLHLSPRTDLHEDDDSRFIKSRALACLRADVPVHLRGPAGGGRTTPALDVAARLGRPVALVMTDDHGMAGGDLLGREVGSFESPVRGRYVHSLTRRETVTRAARTDGVLTRAPSEGWTLVYDEFTRAPATVTNALLSASEERVLVISNPVRGAPRPPVALHTLLERKTEGEP